MQRPVDVDELLDSLEEVTLPIELGNIPHYQEIEEALTSMSLEDLQDAVLMILEEHVPPEQYIDIIGKL